MLTPTQVNNIREQYATGKYSLKSLGQPYGMTRQAIHLIVSGQSYPKVFGPITTGLNKMRHRRRFTDNEVIQIRERLAADSDVRLIDIAAEYDVSNSTIWALASGHRYQDVSGPIYKKRNPKRRPMTKEQREARPHKLTDEQVERIRHRYADGETGVALGAEYGVHPTNIYNICGGIRRNHAGGPITKRRKYVRGTITRKQP